MAATKSKKKTHSTLNALTVAALAIPGLMLPPAHAEEEGEVGFQYSHYEEDDRDLGGIKSAFDPIEVETIQGRGVFKFLDRFKFSFDYVEDTWSGATPVATAPFDMRANRSTAADGVSGASPLINGQLFFDENFNPLVTDGFGNVTDKIDRRVVHTIAGASPESRQKADFNLEYEWDEAAANVGGGLSLENDYKSHFFNLGGRWDFNQKATTLNMGFSYTSSETEAIVDHDIIPYLDTSAFDNQIRVPEPGAKILEGDRDDWAFNVGLTQVLNKSAILEGGVGYTYSKGFLENPYKAVTVAFIDPDLQFLAPDGVFFGDVHGLMEKRPNQRHQLTADLRYIQHVEPFDAALRLGYRIYHDDWGITSHTFDAEWAQPLFDGWIVTPKIRYYSQDEAEFYEQYLVSQQGYEDFNHNLLPNNYSSDHRLSGYGTLSGGVTISKQFARGVSMVAGFEYFTHAGDLKLGGGGEQDFADFDFWTVNGALKVNLATLANSASRSSGGSHHQHKHLKHHGMHAPSGVMFAHMIDKADGIMIGYNFMYGRQAGDFLHGTSTASDREIVNNACRGTAGCRFTPPYMEMKMHMLNIMYAPTDWLNLMLMPKYVSMEMNLDELNGRPPAPIGVHEHTGVAGHTTGGIGDTSLHGLIKLFSNSNHHLHLGLGFSAPTGDSDLEFRRAGQEPGGLVHFAMQTGSGTWDFLPNLTYTGLTDDWSWGAQVSGTVRMENRNDSGYALGDIFQTTAWGGYNFTDWLSVTARGIYTVKGTIRGDFNDINGKSGPMDFPSNQGGRYWDLGVGINAIVPSGNLAGNRLRFEWIQPLEDDVNGYQLERDGSLSASWSYSF